MSAYRNGAGPLNLSLIHIFPDLFRQSLGKLSTIFYMINSMLETGQPLKLNALENLLSELGNYSYHSGLPCADD